MELNIIFKRLGLPKHSDKIFKLLQAKGPLLPFQIAHQLQVCRPAVYLCLKSLKQLNFVYLTTQGKRTYYQAANPRLIDLKFSQTSKKVAQALSKQELKKDILQQRVKFLHGPAGVREAFDDVVDQTPKNQTFYRYTSEQDLDQVNKYLSSHYRNHRDAKKLERLVISNPDSGLRKKSRLERFVKFIPPEVDIFKQNIIQLIYGDRLSLIDLNTEEVIIIENKNLADFQKTIFKQLYKKLS